MRHLTTLAAGTVFTWAGAFPGIAQTTNTPAEPAVVTAAFITQPIRVDGVLDEAEWGRAVPATDFWQNFPEDSVRAKYQTEIRFLFDEQTLYVGVRAETPGDDYVVTSLKRDFQGSTSDNITLLFDTFHDGTNAYAFGLSPYGVQRDILVSRSGAVFEGFNGTWDVKWVSESRMEQDHYVLELAIPFHTMKFPEGSESWRFRSYRFDLQGRERSTWVRVPQNQLLAHLAYMGELRFERPLGRSRTPVSLIPYVNGQVQRDFEIAETARSVPVGGDAKFAIGDGLNLDLTLNPDFSQVEVDDILTNLTRFELLLPEKRQFFVDNSDLFATFGDYYDQARPFFSRRIGLTEDRDGNLIQNRILAGARLSGKLNEQWRVGVLNIQTEEDGANGIPSANNAMVALQRRMSERSALGVFWVNRQISSDAAARFGGSPYNRVVGMDYDLATADNGWQGKFYVHKSLQEDDRSGNLSAQALLTRNLPNWILGSNLTWVDHEFQADLGFVPRTDFMRLGTFAERFFTPGGASAISRHSLMLLAVNYWRPTADYSLDDYTYSLEWGAQFQNQSEVKVIAERQYIYLYKAFDPTRTDGAVPLPAGQGYTFNGLTAEVESNPARRVTLQAQSAVGSFFNGNRFSLGGTLGYRLQPWAQVRLSANYDGIRLPDPYPSADLWLLAPRLDITFNKELYWSTLVQFSSQQENLGVNTRLQWRFAPLSDLYLVYTDNYRSTDFSPQFRSLNLKISYWLTL